jgi:serine/threonine protein kinase
MRLGHGTKLGPYEIFDLLGAGGMGEVYKARDTRLNRTVAVKVLPALFSDNAELRRRLEREARAVSSLSHAHICALFDVGRHDGTDFLVLEYLEGETLAGRLKKGPLPRETALRCAIEMASALDAAHRRGVIHRDLKPGNVMLTRSGSKLLDFGLARVLEKAAEDGATAPVSLDLTATGMILGTLQYMSPEQLEGKEADARSDIFAFGAVLYEMLTGCRAFEGAGQAIQVAAILSSQPPPDPNLLEGPLDRVVRTCLAKDPDERWQSAADLARQLRWIAEARSSAPAAVAGATAGRSSRLPWVAAAVATLAALTMASLYLRSPSADRRSITFTVSTEARLPSQVRISPDGSRLAFVGQNAQGKPMLWVRPLDKLQAQPMPGTEGAGYPFWSPDSRQIAYFDEHEGKLKRIDLAGGRPQVVCDAPLGSGGDWGADGTILFAPDMSSGIYRVPAGGGAPVPVTRPAKAGGGYSFPVILPDGKRFLFFEGSVRTQSSDAPGSVRVASLDGKESWQLMSASCPVQLSSGSDASPKTPSYLLFVRDGSLLAREIDPASLRLRGEALLVADSLAVDVPHNFADFTVSRTGTLALNSAVHQHEVVWLDRSGKRLSPGIPADKYSDPVLSPDGQAAVFQRMDPKAGGSSLWKLDVERGEVSLFAADAILGAFFPGGGSVVFRCSVGGRPAFCRKATGGAMPQEPFWQEDGAVAPVGFSPDGRFLSFLRMGEKYGLSASIWILPLTGDRRPYRFYQNDAEQHHGIFSPDGKWIAYTSNETGIAELYVQPFPATGGKWKVSAQGGAQPRWRRDGTELFYRTGDGKMMAVPIRTAGGFQAGPPRMLFQSSADPLYPNLGVPYDVSADGQKFLVSAALDETRSSPITVITNWAAGLGR